MRKLIILLVAVLCLSVSAHSESVIVGKYHTKEPVEKAYFGTLQATALMFHVTLADKNQGIIQANRRSWSHEVYGNLFVIVNKDADGVSITATFKRQAVLRSGPLTNWARDFGDKLKKELPDLTIEMEKQPEDSSNNTNSPRYY